MLGLKVFFETQRYSLVLYCFKYLIIKCHILELPAQYLSGRIPRDGFYDFHVPFQLLVAFDFCAGKFKQLLYRSCRRRLVIGRRDHNKPERDFAHVFAMAIIWS